MAAKAPVPTESELVKMLRRTAIDTERAAKEAEKENQQRKLGSYFIFTYQLNDRPVLGDGYGTYVLGAVTEEAAHALGRRAVAQRNKEEQQEFGYVLLCTVDYMEPVQLFQPLCPRPDQQMMTPWAVNTPPAFVSPPAPATADSADPLH